MRNAMDHLLPYLKKLLADIDKEAARCKQKGDESLFVKPSAEWTAADHRRYARTSTDKMLADSEKWMQRQLDAEFAARDLRNLIFLREACGRR